MTHSRREWMSRVAHSGASCIATKPPQQFKTAPARKIRTDGGEEMHADDLHSPNKDSSSSIESGRELSQLVLDETRHQLLMNMLGHPQQKPSFKELNYMSSSSKSTISEHLSKLVQYGVVDKLELPKGKRNHGLPRTFYQVSEPGYALLNKVSPIPVADRWLQDQYQQVEKPEKIKQYEELPRTDAERRTDRVDTAKLRQLRELVSNRAGASENTKTDAPLLRGAKKALGREYEKMQRLHSEWKNLTE